MRKDPWDPGRTQHKILPILSCVGANTTLQLCLMICFCLLACCAHTDNEAPPVRVASKAFTESIILGECAVQALAHHGLPVQHKMSLGGSRVLWEALRTGEIDAYPEYLGTFQEMLNTRHTGDNLDTLLLQHGLARTRSLGFSNSYGLAMRTHQARQLGIVTLSNLRKHPHLRTGFSPEFRHRKDCWPNIKTIYKLPQTSSNVLEHDLVYQTLRQKSVDLIDVYTTEAQLAQNWLVVLQDDRNAFPRYDAFFLYRHDLHQKNPQAVAALRSLENQISQKQMIALNQRAVQPGKNERKVAQTFMAQAGFVKNPKQFISQHPFWRQTKEHLQMVIISMILAIAAAVPLGLWAGNNPLAGRLVLGITGVLQTIPSLALLVFMIPLLGIGTLPAVMALFLYSLFPIVRNTATGLRSIPLELQESAQVIGLGRFARLWRIELPLISRHILAGMKTAAVINIGTATLGALVGAGGYGQAILTGIRLNNTSQILQGAIPAACMALLAQGLFGLLDNVMVPKGLRLQERDESTTSNRS